MDEESKRKMSRLVREDNDGTKQAAAKEAKIWVSQETDKNEDIRKIASSNRQVLESRAKKMLDKYKKSPEQENEESGLYSRKAAAGRVRDDIADSKGLTSVVNRVHDTKDGNGILPRNRRDAYAKSLEDAYDEKQYKRGQGKVK